MKCHWYYKVHNFQEFDNISFAKSLGCQVQKYKCNKILIYWTHSKWIVIEKNCWYLWYGCVIIVQVPKYTGTLFSIHSRVESVEERLFALGTGQESLAKWALSFFRELFKYWHLRLILLFSHAWVYARSSLGKSSVPLSIYTCKISISESDTKYVIHSC